MTVKRYPLQEAVNRIVADNPDKVQQARQNPALVGWFVGQVMKEMAGEASEFAVRERLAMRGLKQ